MRFNLSTLMRSDRKARASAEAETLATFRRKIGLKNSRLARLLIRFFDRNVIFFLTEFKKFLLS
jgi:hypothetical protein